VDELKAAVGPIGLRGQNAHAKLEIGRSDGVSYLLYPIDVELKVVVHWPFVARRPNGREAAVGADRLADFHERADLRQIGLELSLVRLPTNRQLKSADFYAGAGQVLASLGDAGRLGSLGDFRDIDLQTLKPVGQGDLQHFALATENADGVGT